MIGAALIGALAAMRSSAGGGADEMFSLVKILLHGEGADGSTTFTDNAPSPLTPTVGGALAIDTDQKKYGEASIKFSASTFLRYDASDDWSLGKGWHKTFEAFVRFDSGSLSGRTPHIFVSSTSGAGGWKQFLLYVTGGMLAYYSDHSFGTNKTNIVALIEERWYHIALVSIGTTSVYQQRRVAIFVDGVPYHVAIASGQVATPRLTFGAHESTSAGNYLLGHMDEVRVTHAARYPIAPEIPTSPPTSDANTSLLLLGAGSDGAAVVDASGNSHTLTTSGLAPTIDTSMSPTGVDGCISFADGSGYLSTPVDADFDFGTGDWTVELWYRTKDTVVDANNKALLSVDGALADGHFYITNRYSSEKAVGLYSRYAGSTISYTCYDNTQMADKTWHHVVWVRSGNFLLAFINGEVRRIFPLAADQKFGISGRGLQVGYSTVSGQHFDGYLCDLRVTKGVARYPATFTPPDAPFPDA